MDDIRHANPSIVAELINALAIQLLVPLVCNRFALENRNKSLADSPKPDVGEETVGCVAKPVMNAEKAKIEQQDG